MNWIELNLKINLDLELSTELELEGVVSRLYGDGEVLVGSKYINRMEG